MNLVNLLLLSANLVNLSSAHFQLRTPVAIGEDHPADQAEGTGPCGGFDLANRDIVTEWPAQGYPVFMITTHPKSVLVFRAALVNDTNSWINLIPPINQYGVYQFCEPSIPGFAPWVGLPAVVQIAQFAPDGINYQCAAVTFTDGPALIPASDACVNSTGNSADAAVGFTSTIPFGSMITPTNTALPTGITGTNATSTGVSPSKTSSATATTSKAASGAVDGFNHHSISGWWTLVAAVLGAWAI
ncbi:hypothetical protein BKA65DRAFT_539862 [Rhexocercosporidium sp. MPI-PUGE-AT-0058]|nr:hypothetical protein BKA65DRAFT_539862 [Rhexocercosporidium sp. MPI-PUGE-AT-0058]